MGLKQQISEFTVHRLENGVSIELGTHNYGGGFGHTVELDENEALALALWLIRAVKASPIPMPEGG